ncbi:MAG: helix-turn-helix transcriptional regulator [Pseudomonadota bacterium]
MADEPDENDIKLGERIRELRQSLGLSGEDLAERMGTSKVQVSRWERGTRRFHLSLLRQIASAIDVAVVDLLYDSESADAIIVKYYAGNGVTTDEPEIPPNERYSFRIPNEGTQLYRGVRKHGIEMRGQGAELEIPIGSIAVLVKKDETDSFMFVVGKWYLIRQFASGKYQHMAKILEQDDAGTLWLSPRTSAPGLQQPIKYSGDNTKEYELVGQIVGFYRPL